jgi:hypothetical protein
MTLFALFPSFGFNQDSGPRSKHISLISMVAFESCWWPRGGPAPGRPPPPGSTPGLVKNGLTPPVNM